MNITDKGYDRTQYPVFPNVYRIVERHERQTVRRYNARLTTPPERDDDGGFTLGFEETSEPANSGTIYIDQ